VQAPATVLAVDVNTQCRYTTSRSFAAGVSCPVLDAEAVDGDAELQVAAAPTRTIHEPQR